jgi:hypothetical protein
MERDKKRRRSLFFPGKTEAPLRCHLEHVPFLLFVQEGKSIFTVLVVDGRIMLRLDSQAFLCCGYISYFRYDTETFKD